MPSPLLRIVGRSVRRIRKAARITQEQLAAEAGVHVNTIINLEKGKLETVQLSTLEIVAAVLGCQVTELCSPPGEERIGHIEERLAVLEQGHVDVLRNDIDAFAARPSEATMTTAGVTTLVEAMLCKCLPPGVAAERAHNIAAALSGIRVLP
jgi:transcriptional regulator with XRE-family HTH domain